MRSAHTVRLEFQEGCLDRTELVDWVAAQLEALDPAPSALLDLVPLVGLEDAEIEARLREIAPDISPAVEARLRIDVLCDGYRRGRIALDDVALRLELAASRDLDRLEPDVRDSATGLHDTLQLARSGTYGTVEEAEEAVREFVAEYGRPLA